MLNKRVVKNALFDTFWTETKDSKEFLVVKGVPLVEGVLNGRFVGADEFGAFPADWNGVPVVMRHPQANGGSARIPHVDVPVIGNFYNAKLDGTRLVGEFWMDKEKLLATPEGETLFIQIQNQHPIEISTGYNAESIPEAGNWNGKDFSLVDTNLRADHIALLPDDIGACSIKDGCGLNRHSKDLGNNWELSQHKQNIQLNTEESLDQKSQRIRSAFNNLMTKPQPGQPQEAGVSVEQQYAYVTEIFYDQEYVIVEMTGNLHRVSFHDFGSNVVFDEMAMWTPVSIEYVTNQLEKNIKNAPETMSKMWDKVYASALKTYEGDKEKAAASAWAAVKKQYKKDGEKWVKKNQSEDLDPAVAEGFAHLLVMVTD